jgi:hypothetical protein
LAAAADKKTFNLLKLLKARGRKISYTPSDVSVAMVLVARAGRAESPAGEKVFSVRLRPGDGESTKLAMKILVTRHPSLVTFFGMIPNFEPQRILPKLTELSRPE